MSAPSTPRRARPSRSKRSMNTLKKIAVCAGLTSASALLGLSEGDEIHWPNPNGGTLHLVVFEVEDQPERAGRYDQ